MCGIRHSLGRVDTAKNKPLTSCLFVTDVCVLTSKITNDNHHCDYTRRVEPSLRIGYRSPNDRDLALTVRDVIAVIHPYSITGRGSLSALAMTDMTFCLAVKRVDGDLIVTERPVIPALVTVVRVIVVRVLVAVLVAEERKGRENAPCLRLRTNSLTPSEEKGTTGRRLDPS